jgi:curved DNA-binding protein CbpA
MESIVADVSFSMLIIRWHQNRPNADDAKKAERILQHLTEAKNTLEDDYQRFLYDLYLFHQEGNNLPKQDMTWKEFSARFPSEGNNVNDLNMHYYELFGMNAKSFDKDEMLKRWRRMSLL